MNKPSMYEQDLAAKITILENKIRRHLADAVAAAEQSSLLQEELEELLEARREPTYMEAMETRQELGIASPDDMTLCGFFTILAEQLDASFEEQAVHDWAVRILTHAPITQ